MNFGKRHLVFITIHLFICLVWVMLPDINRASEGCYTNIAGGSVNYTVFNKYQFYYFLAVNFVFGAVFKQMTLKRFAIIELFLILPVIILLYVYICAK